MVAVPYLPPTEPSSEAPPTRAETVAYVEELLAELAHLAKGAEALRLAEAIENARQVAVTERPEVSSQSASDRSTRAANPPDSDSA